MCGLASERRAFLTQTRAVLPSRVHGRYGVRVSPKRASR